MPSIAMLSSASSRVLDLEPLQLRSIPDKLTLSVTSSVRLQVPGNNFDQDDLRALLTSGKTWALIRGNSCGLDINISFNGQQLENNQRMHVLECLGHSLQDAHVWPRLHLSPSLVVSQHAERSKPDVSIQLGRRTPPANLSVNPTDWLANQIDIRAPAGVPQAELGRIQLSLDFCIPYKDHQSQKGKTGDVVEPSQEHGPDDSMILDPIIELQPDDDMLLSPGPNTDYMLLDPFETAEDEMLFSQTYRNVVSQTTTISTSSSECLGSSRPTQPELFPAPQACKLTDAALRILISGYDRRRTRGMLGLRVDKPLPSTALSDLAPGVFSPSFREVMSHNITFLPKISNIISSWPNHILSPILQSKLGRLGEPPGYLAEDLHRRLWAIMQGKLYDKASTRSFLNPGKGDEKENVSKFVQAPDEDDFEDILGDYFEEDDDLLGFLDATEQERQGTEHVTDGLLFEGSEDDMLLDEASGNESMMLF